jgi:hypothetical protein
MVGSTNGGVSVASRTGSGRTSAVNFQGIRVLQDLCLCVRTHGATCLAIYIPSKPKRDCKKR